MWDGTSRLRSVVKKVNLGRCGQSSLLELKENATLITTNVISICHSNLIIKIQAIYIFLCVIFVCREFVYRFFFVFKLFSNVIYCMYMYLPIIILIKS